MQRILTARALAAACFGATLALSLPAATPLFDFETPADLAAWTWASRGQSALWLEPVYATRGSNALCFTSRAWEKGSPEWPAFETRPILTNWSGYDRLVVDITHPGVDHPVFALFISDSKTPLRKGLSYRFDMPARGCRRFEIPLSGFPKTIDRSAISILHFYTERPKQDTALHLDNAVLLRPGETLPPPDAKFAAQIALLTCQAADDAAQSAARELAAAETLSPDAEFRQSARARLSARAAQIQTLRTEAASATPALARLEQIREALAETPALVARDLSTLRFHAASLQLGLPARDYLLGVATSMEKLPPRQGAFDLKPVRRVELSLARNEKESVQLAVIPLAGALRKVAVKTTGLSGPAGALFKPENIQCDVVGSVEITNRAPYDAPHTGWWPDPLLNFLGPVDIAPGDLQSFWIRFRAPKDQPPGLYRGVLTVSAEGLPDRAVETSVQVYSFTLPDRSPLPLAITFSPEDSPLPQTAKAQDQWRKDPGYPVQAWRNQKTQWAEMLADYYVTYDSLYHHGQPDFALLERLHRQGRLGLFNLGYYGPCGSTPAEIERWKTGNFPRFRQAYAKASELGLLDHAYLYGCDEATVDLFPKVEQAAALLKAEFPGVPVMTTTYDASYGQKSVIRSMDAFCPLTPSFDPAKAAVARAAGKSVWWYICCGPHHPHANMFIEYPAIEGRLLMGAMTARQRPDGFLYYQISIWNSRQPITRGPFTDWDPRSWTTYHGDGSWTCVGPGGAPVPTIRLENFRDGLEDFAYVQVLEAIIARRQAKGAGLSPAETQWLAQARAALSPPESLMKSMTEYSRNPAALYEWRNRIGALIDQSGEKEVNPWDGPDKPAARGKTTAATQGTPRTLAPAP